MRVIAIYCIKSIDTGKVYVGKSVNVKARWYAHRSALKDTAFNKKKCNRRLWADVQKFGIDRFEFSILEQFEEVEESVLSDREVFWMDKLQAYDSGKGYNLMRDSSTSTLVSESTRAKHRANGIGITNPNWGNRWSDEQKEDMRKNRLSRSNRYGDEWKEKISAASKKLWSDKDKLKAMSEKVRESLLKYEFVQMDENFNVIRIWPDMRTLVEETGYAKQCVYSVCDGYKQRYKGFRWRKVLRSAK